MSEVGYRDVLSFLHKTIKPDWYLEIGSRTGESLSKVDCSYIAIDPEFRIRADVFNTSHAMMFFQQTSDDFFASCFLQNSGIKPDLAFIDGMHLFEFALRDFMNLEQVMGEGGVICLHDVCPINYNMAVRDPAHVEGNYGWTGDVWKTIAALLDVRPDLDITILDAHKTGLAVVRNLKQGNMILSERYDELMARYLDLDLKSSGANAYYNRFKMTNSSDFMRTFKK